MKRKSKTKNFVQLNMNLMHVLYSLFKECLLLLLLLIHFSSVYCFSRMISIIHMLHCCIAIKMSLIFASIFDLFLLVCLFWRFTNLSYVISFFSDYFFWLSLIAVFPQFISTWFLWNISLFICFVFFSSLLCCINLI